MERPFGVWRRVSGLLVFAGTSALLVVGACQDAPTTIATEIIRDTLIVHDTVRIVDTLIVVDTVTVVDTVLVYCHEYDNDRDDWVQCENGYRGPR